VLTDVGESSAQPLSPRVPQLPSSSQSDLRGNQPPLRSSDKTFTDGVYNDIPKTNHVSAVYNVRSVLYIQSVLHVMLFRT
jgi:hypothetical protein